MLNSRPDTAQSVVNTIVDAHMPLWLTVEGVIGDTIHANDAPWATLVTMLRGAGVTDAEVDGVWDRLDGTDADARRRWTVLTEMLESHANAGFLLGLELGRQLGGAR